MKELLLLPVAFFPDVLEYRHDSAGGDYDHSRTTNYHRLTVRKNKSSPCLDNEHHVHTHQGKKWLNEKLSDFVNVFLMYLHVTYSYVLRPTFGFMYAATPTRQPNDAPTHIRLFAFALANQGSSKHPSYLVPVPISS